MSFPDKQNFAFTRDYCISLLGKKNYWKIYHYNYFNLQLLLLLTFTLNFSLTFIIFKHYGTGELIYYLFLILLLPDGIFLLFIFNAYLSDIKNKEVDFWIVENKAKIVGQAKVINQKNYSILFFLSVNHQHRHHRLGSFLVLNAIRNSPKPVYLWCPPKLQSFYARLGFRNCSKQEMPPKLRKYLGICNPMVLY